MMNEEFFLPGRRDSNPRCGRCLFPSIVRLRCMGAARIASTAGIEPAHDPTPLIHYRAAPSGWKCPRSSRLPCRVAYSGLGLRGVGVW